MITTLVVVLGYVTPTSVINHALAQVQEQTQSVRVPAMRNRVYTQFARAQKIADEGNKAEGLAVLDSVKARISSLNEYERAMLWNFYGFMHYANDDLANAIANFNKVVAEQAIPQSLRLSTLYSLAQLSMQQEQYQQTIEYLTRWQAINTEPLTANQHVLFAQVYYQNKQYQQSLTSIERAIEIAEENSELAKENWLILQRANYYELGQPKQVTKVMEALVHHYSKPEYWLQLSGMYGEIGEQEKQLSVMETAYQNGFISKPQDIISLAQLYRLHHVPIKAAMLLSEAIDTGAIIANEKHLAMQAQAFIAAKESTKSIPVLKKAAEIAENGEFDAQLAQVYLNLAHWQLAIDAADTALKRGGVERTGNLHLIIGMAYFNLAKFNESLLAFKEAENITSSAKMAKQWTKYVEREQGQQLAMLARE